MTALSALSRDSVVLNSNSAAKQVLIKLDDAPALMALYVEHKKWDDAFLMLNAHPGELTAKCSTALHLSCHLMPLVAQMPWSLLFIIIHLVCVEYKYCRSRSR